MENNLLKMRFDLKQSEIDEKDYLASSLPLKSVNIVDSLKDEFWAGGKEGYICYNQGNTGQCAGFGIAGRVQKADKTHRRFSPIFVYGNRFDEGEYLGEGMHIRECLKDLKRDGCCTYDELPQGNIVTYTQAIEAFSKLDSSVLDKAKDNRIEYYYRVDHRNTQEIISVLETYNQPIVIGWLVYGDVVKAYSNGGILESSYVGSNNYLGGHCSIVCGYKRINGKMYFIIQNSWGDNIADNGFFYMLFDTNYVFEMWMSLPYEKRDVKFKIDSNVYWVNGKEKYMDSKAKIINGRTYVPLRTAFEEMGAIISWNYALKSAKIFRGGVTYYFKADGDTSKQNYFQDDITGKSHYYEDEESRKSLTYHFIDENNRILVPVRKVFEVVGGYNVEWDDENKIVTIKNY